MQVDEKRGTDTSNDVAGRVLKNIHASPYRPHYVTGSNTKNKVLLTKGDGFRGLLAEKDHERKFRRIRRVQLTYEGSSSTLTELL
jgi:hypothetical protein